MGSGQQNNVGTRFVLATMFDTASVPARIYVSQHMSPMFWVSDGKELSSLCLFMLRAVLVTSHEKPYLLGKIRVA